jgi:hypothetical protein
LPQPGRDNDQIREFSDGFVHNRICKTYAGQALKISEDASGTSEYLKAIRQSTRGVFFFGTPHSGASIADLGETIIRIGGVFGTTNSTLLAALNAKNETGELERLREDFDKMLGPRREGKFEAVNFREKSPLLSKPKTPLANLVWLPCVFNGRSSADALDEDCSARIGAYREQVG